MVIDELYSKLHLMMSIVVVGIEDYPLPSINSHAKITFPEVAVDKAGPNLPSLILKCSQKPRNHLLLHPHHYKL